MTDPCINISGWGATSFGSGPWGGAYLDSSDFLPTYPPFDIFCLGPCGSLQTVILYPGVEVQPGGQWVFDPASDSLHLWSGEDLSSSQPAFLEISTGIPDEFSVQWQLRFDELPADFSDPENYKMHIGVGSHQGCIAGLMFSDIGIAFVPCPDDVSSAVPLPGSAGLISLGQTYIIKMVVSSTTTYVYITTYTDYVLNGHTLRFVLPSVQAEVICPDFLIDLAWLRLDGDTSNKVDVRLGSFCVSSRLLITDFPPIADAGPDQAAQFCSIVQLDGTSSKDPEGSGLVYSWRLLDAPVGSGFVLDGLLGQTYPLPFPISYTDKWYCAQLSSLSPGDVSPGDILMVLGQPYTVLALGTDLLHGDYIQVTAPIIPDNLPLLSGKILRQFGISGADTAKPTFYPDVPGFYKFDLIVFDGAAWSTPSVTVVNVVSSTIPRGVVPDMRFIWEYLSDFWKMVDDKGRYTVVWSGLAQFCAAELLNLWQYEYNKSLRDIQRTFQRRWLAYNLRYLPYKTLSSLRTLYTPFDSDPFDPTSVPGAAGTYITFYSPTGVSVRVDFFLPTGVSVMTADVIAEQITTVLAQTALSGLTVSIVDLQDAPPLAMIRVTAPYPFSVIANTCPIFAVSPMSSTIGGTGGLSQWEGTSYKVGMSLSSLGIVENDFLEVDGEMYRIIKLTTSEGGLPNDTIVLKDTLPAGASTSWSIPCYFKYAEADFYGELVTSGDDVVLDIRNLSGAGSYYRARALGAAVAEPSVVGVDTSGLDLFLAASEYYTITLMSVYRRRYTPISELIVDIPHLQEVLTDSPESGILRRNLDFYLERFRDKRCIRFDERIWLHEVDGELVPDAYPPVALWAETTYLDNRPTIEANFGLPVNFTLDKLEGLGNSVDYLSAVRGLWYSYFNGPRVGVLRSGAQILLGLPFAEEDGTIEEIRTDYSPNTARILVRDNQTTQVVRSYAYPRVLSLETNPKTGASYAVGDSVAQFAPLVKGVEFLDYVSDKTWIDNYVAGGGASSLQRFFRFLMRVDYGAFNLAALMFVREFVLKVKPTYTYPIFAVLFNTDDTTIDVSDFVDFYGIFSIFDSPMMGHNMARMWDQPEDGYASVTKVPPMGPMGSIWKNSYDCSQVPPGVDWGYDKLTPSDEVEATMCTEFLALTLPTLDSVFAWDLPVYDPADPGTPIAWAYDTGLPAGTYCRDKTL